MSTAKTPLTPQQMLNTPCTTVLVELTIRAGIDPQRVMPHMAEEVRDTVKLYLDGHILQWFALCDKPGVVFLFAARDTETVNAWMAGLPLVQNELVDLKFTKLGALSPLRLLLNEPKPPAP